MAYTKTEMAVENVIDDDSVVDSVIVESDEPLTIVFGTLLNGNDVTSTARHFGVVDIQRDLDEDEQAVYQQEQTNFASVLIANEDGEASNDQLLSVTGGSIDDAIEALEQVTADGTIDFREAASKNFEVEDGTVVDNTVEPLQAEETGEEA